MTSANRKRLIAIVWRFPWLVFVIPAKWVGIVLYSIDAQEWKPPGCTCPPGKSCYERCGE